MAEDEDRSAGSGHKRVRLKLRKFLLRHPILTGVAASKIADWLDKGEAAVRNIFSPSARHSANAPIPPSASAPIPPKLVPSNAPHFVWPINEPNAKMRFTRHSFGFGIFINTYSDGVADVRAAGSGVVSAVGYHEPNMFSIIIQHSQGFLTNCAGFGNALVEKGMTVEDGQHIARLPSVLYLEMMHNYQVVDPRAYLPPFSGSIEQEQERRIVTFEEGALPMFARETLVSFVQTTFVPREPPQR